MSAGRSIKFQVAVLLPAVVVFFTNLGGPTLWDDDEPRNAQCACEMLLRGDYVVPTFNQELRCDKPVLLYWLMISAYRTFGVSEFAARFWSAVLAVGTIWATYHLGRMLFRAQVGMWAGWMLSASLLFVVAGRAATPDSALVFCTTLALLAFVRATWGATPTLAGANELRDFLPKTWVGFGSVYAAMGLGVLAKGPVGVVLPTTVLGLYLLHVRQTIGAMRRSAGAGCSGESRWRSPAGRRDAYTTMPLARWISPRGWLSVVWSLRPLTALVVIGAVALPWYAAVGLATQGDWPAGFLGRHNLGRFLAPMENHRGLIFYYIPAILAGFFPWSIFLPGSLVETVRQLRRDRWPAYAFLVCWAGVYVAFFSLSATKLPSYVLPAYPALAVLTAAFVDGWLRREVKLPRWLLLLAVSVLGIVGLGFFVGLRIAAARFLPGEEHLELVGLIPIVGAVAGCWFAWHDRRRLVAVTFAAASLALAVAAFGFVSERVARHQNSPSLAATALDSRSKPPRWGIFDLISPSLVFYTRRRVEPLATVDQVRRFLRSEPHALVVTRSQGLAALQGVLGRDMVVLARQRRFLRDDEVFVLAPAATAAAGTARRPAPWSR